MSFRSRSSSICYTRIFWRYYSTLKWLTGWLVGCKKRLQNIELLCLVFYTMKNSDILLKTITAQVLTFFSWVLVIFVFYLRNTACILKSFLFKLSRFLPWHDCSNDQTKRTVKRENRSTSFPTICWWVLPSLKRPCMLLFSISIIKKL